MSLILRKFSTIFIALRDFYFEYGQLLVDQLDRNLAKKAFEAKNRDQELKRKFEDQTKPSMFGFSAFLERAGNLRKSILPEENIEHGGLLPTVEDYFTESFFYTYTAAVLGHARARTHVALFYL